MAIVDKHINTKDPWIGLSPRVLNVPVQWQISAAASASASVFTTSNYFTLSAKAGSFAAGTQPDYPRNVVVRLTPSTGSSSLHSAGGVTIYGRDAFMSTRSESWAATALNTISAGIAGSVCFRQVDTISASLVLHTASSSAGANVSLHVGRGQVLNLPFEIKSQNAAYAVHLGTVEKFTYTHSDSTSTNQWSLQTGPYYRAGIALTDAYTSGSPVNVECKLIGFAAPTHDSDW